MPPGRQPLLLPRRPALLPGAPDLVGFGHAQMTKGALAVAAERPLAAAIAGAGLPIAILGPVASLLAVVQDAVEEFAAVFTPAHRMPQKV